MGVIQVAKKKINSKNKGNEYERKIAKILGNWYRDEFHRVPMSGGLRWGEDSRVAGDIVAHKDSTYPFTTECKKRQGWDLEQVLKGTGDVESWWEQSVDDSNRVNLKPLLIFSKNYSPDYMMIRLCDFTHIMEAKGKDYVADENFNFFIVCKVGESPRVVCNLNDFISNVSREDIEKAFNLVDSH